MKGFFSIMLYGIILRNEQNWTFGGGTFGQKYTYDAADDTLKKIEMTTPVNSFKPTVSYTYNSLRQLTQKTTDGVFYRKYEYRNIDQQRTAQISKLESRNTKGTLLLSDTYAYDNDTLTALTNTTLAGSDTVAYTHNALR